MSLNGLPLVRYLNASCFLSNGAREGAALVAKKLAFE